MWSGEHRLILPTAIMSRKRPWRIGLFTKSHANLWAPNRGIKADLTDDIGGIVQDRRGLGEKSGVCVRDQNASKYVNIPGSKNDVVSSKAL